MRTRCTSSALSAPASAAFAGSDGMKLLALLAVCAGLATAQSEPISLSGSILGTNGLPLRKANVLLQPQGPPSRGQAMPVPYSATSDPLGQFSFTGIEPGRYILT